MKVNAFALAGLGTAVLAGSASAGFVDVTWTTTVIAPGITTYRFFANFDSPTDSVLAVSGSLADVPVAFSTNTTLHNEGGAFAGTKQEDFAQFPISGIQDSWVTIGATGFAGNDTGYSPNFLGNDGMLAVIVGSSWSDPKEGWFDGDPSTQSNGSSIAIAQFSVVDKPSGDRGEVRFSGGVDWQPGGAGLDRSTFAVNTPAPGALALLGLAGLAGTRRRRG